MSNKRSDQSLSDRVHGRKPRQELPCHVWVDGCAALLVAWRRVDDGSWWGRVAIVTDGERVGECWILSSRISPDKPEAK